MQLQRAYRMDEVTSQDVADTAVDIPINSRVFMIANTGVQPIYIDPAKTATAATGFLVPAGTVLPQYLSCDDNLSVISDATGSTVAILFLDV